MSAYFVASIAIHDREEYEKYLAGADSVFISCGGNHFLSLPASPERK